MAKIIEKNDNFVIQEVINMQKKRDVRMYVSDAVAKFYDKYNKFDQIINDTRRYKDNLLQTDLTVKIEMPSAGRIAIDIKFILVENEVEGFRFGVAGLSGDFGFNLNLRQRFRLGVRAKMQTFTELANIIKKENYSIDKENNMDDKKLREFIRAKVLEYLTEQKILKEADKKESKKTVKGKAKPTSGMELLKVGDTHTSKTKESKPNFKVSDIGPDEKTFLTGTEPEPVGNETKEIEDKTDEALERGKYPGAVPDGFKSKDMGVDLEVKGASYANINSLYLLAQIRKALEGRGTYVKKVTIEMGEPDELNESKEVKELRNKIRTIIKEQLKKKI